MAEGRYEWCNEGWVQSSEMTRLSVSGDGVACSETDHGRLLCVLWSAFCLSFLFSCSLVLLFSLCLCLSLSLSFVFSFLPALSRHDTLVLSSRLYFCRLFHSVIRALDHSFIAFSQT